MPQSDSTRLDRIEAAIERLAEENRIGFAELRETDKRLKARIEDLAEETAEFKRVVRGAFEVQQKQIGDNAAAIAQLHKHMGAYLRRNRQ